MLFEYSFKSSRFPATGGDVIWLVAMNSHPLKVQISPELTPSGAMLVGSIY